MFNDAKLDFCRIIAAAIVVISLEHAVRCAPLQGQDTKAEDYPGHVVRYLNRLYDESTQILASR